MHVRSQTTLDIRGVVPWGAGDAMAPPDFGRSVNPISTRGTDYVHLITTGTPGFSDLPTALSYDSRPESQCDRTFVLLAILFLGRFFYILLMYLLTYKFGA